MGSEPDSRGETEKYNMVRKGERYLRQFDPNAERPAETGEGRGPL